ncbi:hypothetical protein [Nocardia takedensis]|uniref:hypothetical protein n=1 Tax=Nocardia takedensis TaxID=259390 RepID=UPI000686BA8F|nr:hypothetical protein [Nocardia takedensis]
MMWVVTLRYASDGIDREVLDSWEDELEDLDATAGRLPGTATTLTVYIDAVELVGALAEAGRLVRPITGLDPAGAEVVDERTYLDRADEPTLPRLVSAVEVGDMLAISRQRVHQLQSTVGFPEPLYRLRTGPVWDARAIEAFATRWDRRPGRRGGDARISGPERVADARSAADLAAELAVQPPRRTMSRGGAPRKRAES